ncbi:MAG: zinc ribbon domain-containing protein [Actinomycetes bacterium]
MAGLDELLELQQLDTRIDQLEHQLRSLPVRAELDEASARRIAAAAATAEVRTRLEEMRAEQEHLESEALDAASRADAVEASLYDGSVSAHKDLEAMQAEIGMLRSRQAHFEDRAIGVMEESEPVESELATAQHVVDELDAAITSLEARLEDEAGDVLRALESVRGERERAVDAVDSDLLADYEPLRARLGGIAVARLTGARCEGCFMEIPSAQLEAVRRLPESTIATCPECGRMLVR